MVKAHELTTIIGLIAILFAIVGYYYYDVSIFKNAFEIDHFHNQQTNMVILVFMGAALLVVGLCIYLVNLLLSNFTDDKEV